MRRRARRPAASAVVTVAGLACLVAAVTGARHDAQGGRAPDVAATDVGPPVTASTTAASTATAASATAASTSTATASLASDLAPVDRVVAARVGLDAPVEAVGVRGRALDVPADPRTVGWWRSGARPGATAGVVVLDGHVNRAGTTGALAAVPHLHPGDDVVLRTGARTYRYAVRSVHSYAKASGLPAQLFVTTGSPALVLITCGGVFDRATGHYEDNVVASAVPEPPTAPAS